jgi:hypothetical protein
MPVFVDYYSDASFSSETESDAEDEEQELYDPRDTEYWAIDSLMDSRKPPPVIEYLCALSSFDLRECVVMSVRRDIDAVVDSRSVRSWYTFWRREAEPVPSANFSHDDWDAIGEFAMQLCECCLDNPDHERIQSCIIRILSWGRFVRRPLAVALPVARRLQIRNQSR